MTNETMNSPQPMANNAAPDAKLSAAANGDAQHDWDKNDDGSDCNTQRESDMRTSFGHTDNYAEGPEFSGRFSIETKGDVNAEQTKGFKPLKGNITKTVEKN